MPKTIREWRLQAGLTQRELAVKVGIHWTQVSLHENGHAAPNGRTLQRYAEVFGCNASEIRLLEAAA